MRKCNNELNVLLKLNEFKQSMEDEGKELRKQQEKLVKLANEAGEICRAMVVCFFPIQTKFEHCLNYKNKCVLLKRN